MIITKKLLGNFEKWNKKKNILGILYNKVKTAWKKWWYLKNEIQGGSLHHWSDDCVTTIACNDEIKDNAA